MADGQDGMMEAQMTLSYFHVTSVFSLCAQQNDYTAESIYFFFRFV